jgi:ubiquitin fusion degradation protein 1
MADLNDAARRHKREQEKRRMDAKRKLEKQQALEQQAIQQNKEIEERRAQIEAEARAAREKEAEENRRNDGVHFSQTFTPVPTLREDDKLLLPPSVLDILEKQNAFSVGTPLTFQVTLTAGRGSASVTHAGVGEFTAEEGSVGIPPKVALCLTKAAGLEKLEQVGQIRVRYVRLDRTPKCSATVQPRGVGFHIDGQEVVNLDLQKVLERTLQSHATLTEGDWLPVRHEGRAYELVIRTLEPEAAISLLNTDLEVVMLPSEHAEAERLAEEAAQRAREARERRKTELEEAKRQEAARKASMLLEEPPEGTEGVVKMIIRLPSGASTVRRMLKSGAFRNVLDWVESDWEGARAEAGRYKLVQSWPGHRREFGVAEAAETLQALGFNGRQEALFLQKEGEIIEEQQADEEMPPAAIEAAPPASLPNGAWGDAERELRERSAKPEEEGTPTAAVRQEPQLERIQGQELVEIFNLLKASGLPPQRAAAASQKWGAQLRELMGMGFVQWEPMVELLDRYNGRVLRVANALAEMEPTDSDVPMPDAVPAVAAPEAAPVASPQVTPIAPPEVPQGVDSTHAAWENELVQLAGMGFTDEHRNIELLVKYQGRLERVVNILCGAD